MVTRYRRAVWAILAAAALGAPGPAAATPAARPDLLLITVDTLRPDALGWIGGKNETPHLDRLAAEGVAFPAAVTPLPLTLPAHASLLTGLLPRRHGVRDNGLMLPEGVATLATRLAGAGYETAAFVSGFPLQRIFGLDRGFELYDDSMPEGEQGWVERKAQQTTEAALAWLAARSADPDRRPWFLWVHYYDPHDPYEPPRVFWQPGERGAYDGEVAYADHWIGKLLAGPPPPTPPQPGAAPKPAARPRLTVFAGDHGEALGEHRESRHGYFVYDSTVLVPLVFHFPGRLEPRRSDFPARLVDVAPTILELLGLAAPVTLDDRDLDPGDLDGTSLVPTLSGREQAAGPAYVETQLPYRFFGWAPLSAVRHEGWKLIAAPRPELYDLRADPGERENLIDERRPKARELQAAMRAIERRAAATAATTEDPEVVARLRSLGYVGAGGGNEPDPQDLSGLADPKDRIAERDALLAGEDLLRAGRLEEAVAQFDAVLAGDPGNRYATLRSGIALLGLGRVAAASERLALAVEADPDRAEARYAYADALTRGGRLEPAAEQWMEVIRLQPRRFEAWANLGHVLERSGRCGRADEAYAQAEALAPESASRERQGPCSPSAGEPATGDPDR